MRKYFVTNTIPLPFLSCAILFSSFLSARATFSADDAVFQSGPIDSNSYAGGVVYDSESKSIVITGATHQLSAEHTPTIETSCFLGILSWPDLRWVDERVIGDPDIEESCTGVSMGVSSAVVIGSTAKGGLYADHGSREAQQYGFVMNVGFQEGKIGAALDGVSLQRSRIQSPISIVTNESDIFVATLESDELSLSSDVSTTRSEEAYSPATFGTTIRKFIVDGSTIRPSWVQKVSDSSATNIYPGGLLVKENLLLVVGSTTGEKAWEDGYITKHDLGTGDFSGSQAHAYMWGDMLTSICDNPDDSEYFYVVGTTRGDDGNLAPVITKVTLASLSVLWTKAVYPQSTTSGIAATARGLACKVSDDVVYVAGSIEDNASFEHTESSGSDDVFLWQLDTLSGSSLWIQQIGSSEKDTLARGDGLAVDDAGNAILFGSTKGSLFRQKEEDGGSDIFMAIIKKLDGSYEKLSSLQETETETEAEAEAETEAGEDIGSSYDAHVISNGPEYEGDTESAADLFESSEDAFGTVEIEVSKAEKEQPDEERGILVTIYALALFALLIGLAFAQLSVLVRLGENSESNEDANRRDRSRRNLAPAGRDFV